MSYLDDNIKKILSKNETYDNIGYHLAKLLADSFLEFYEVKSEADSELVNCFKKEITNLIRSYKVEDYQKFLNDKIHLKVFIKDLSYLLNNNAKVAFLLEKRTKKYFQQLNSQQKKQVREKIEKKIKLPFYAEDSVKLIEQKLNNEAEIKNSLLNLDQYKNKNDREFVLSLTEILNLEQDKKSLELQLINLNSSLQALVVMRVDLANLNKLSLNKWKKYLALDISQEQVLKLSVLINDYYKEKELEFVNKHQNITTLAKNKEINKLDSFDEENLEKLRGLINYGNVEIAINNFLSHSAKTKRTKSSSNTQTQNVSWKTESEQEEKKEGKKRGSYLSESDIKKHIDQQINNPEFVSYWQNLSLEEQQNVWADLKKRNYNVLQPISSEFDKKTGDEYLQAPPDDILYRYLREIHNENKLTDSKTKENNNLISHLNSKGKQDFIKNLPEETKKKLKQKANIDFQNPTDKDIETALFYLEPNEVVETIKKISFIKEKEKLENSNSSQPISQNATQNFAPISSQSQETNNENKNTKKGSYDYEGKIEIPKEGEFKDEKISAIWNSFSDEERRSVYQYANIGINAEDENSFDGITMGNLTSNDIYAYQNHKKELAKIKQNELKHLPEKQIQQLSQKFNTSPQELQKQVASGKIPLEEINKLSTQSKQQNVSKMVVNSTVSQNNYNDLAKQQQDALMAKKEKEFLKEIEEELKSKEYSQEEISQALNEVRQEFQAHFAPQFQTNTADIENLENQDSVAGVATGASIGSNGSFVQKFKQVADDKFIKKLRKKTIKKAGQKSAKKAIGAATKGVPGLNAATTALSAFQALFDEQKQEELKKFFSIISAIAGAIIIALIKLMALIGAIVTGAVIGAIIGGIIGTFFGPAGTAIGAAVGGAVGGGAGYFWDKIQLGFHNAMGSIGNFFSSLWGNVTGFFQAMITGPVGWFSIGMGGFFGFTTYHTTQTNNVIETAMSKPINEESLTEFSSIDAKFFDFANNSFKFNQYLIGQIDHEIIKSDGENKTISYNLQLEKRSGNQKNQIVINNINFTNYFTCSENNSDCPASQDLSKNLNKELKRSDLIESQKNFNVQTSIVNLNNVKITTLIDVDFSVYQKKEASASGNLDGASPSAKTKIIDLSLIQNTSKNANTAGKIEVAKNQKLKLSNTICLGNCTSNDKFCWPASGIITQLPFGGFSHQKSDAYDIANSVGKPIFSTDGGQVRYFFGALCGNGAYLTMNNGENLLFCHMLKRQIGVKTVQRGDLIGLMGSTGWSTGSHLHYEIKPAGPSLIKSNITKYLPNETKFPRVGQKVETCYFNY